LSGSVAIVRDVTEAKRAEEALRASEERYALAAQGANDGLWDWDLVSGKIYFAPRWKAMLGYTDDDIGTSPDEWFHRLHPDDRERVEWRLLAHTRRLITSFELEYRILHRDGKCYSQCRDTAECDQDRVDRKHICHAPGDSHRPIERTAFTGSRRVHR
jgi:PAS domain S-box-containing protein